MIASLARYINILDFGNMAQHSKTCGIERKITAPPLKIHEKCPYGLSKIPSHNTLRELDKPEITIKPARTDFCSDGGKGGKSMEDAMEMSIQFHLPDAEDPRRKTYLSNLFGIMEPFFESSESTVNTKNTTKKPKSDSHSKVSTMFYAEFK